MRALRKLVQTRRPHCQDKDDPDRQGRENDHHPICMSDHGCTCLVDRERPPSLPHYPTVAHFTKVFQAPAFQALAIAGPLPGLRSSARIQWPTHG